MRVMSVGALVVCGALAMSGCGGSGGNYGGTTAPSPTSGGGTTPGQNAAVIAITATNGAQSFSPNPSNVQSGQAIVFRNSDSVAHRIVLDNGSLDTGLIAAGQSSAALSWSGASGTYHCTIHPSMVGSINQPTPTAPSDPTPGY